MISLSIHSMSYADITPVSDRTSQVRDAIITAAGVNTAADVTDTHLAAITSLNLRNAGITELQSGDFSGLTGLTDLNLYGNELSSLPDGIFEGLTALTTLRLGGNTVEPMPITVSLEKVADGQFKAIAPIGAPFDIVLPISATNGSIADNTTSITISKGSTESSTLTITRTADTTAAVTTNIGTLPSLPTNHYGYSLSKSSALPVEIISEVVTTTPIVPETVVPETSTNTAPVFTDGSTAIRSIAENTATETNIGTAISATDANSDTLTYSLGGTDASSFSIDSMIGQLKTKLALDYETKRVYSVTITVSDGTLTDTITVIINIIDVSETTIASTSLPVSQRTTQVRDAIVAAVPNVTDAADITDTHLATITSLNLRSTGITALQSGDFSGLTSLTSINLYGNMLSSLPSSIFEGLTALTSLRLGGNLVVPMPLIVSIQQVSTGQFKAVIAEGAPFDISVPVNGNTVTISKGSTASTTFTSTINVSMGTLPSLPANHFGYVIAKSAICNRTTPVAEAITAAVPNVTDCNNVTEADLATITSLDLSSKSITSLQSDDFAGLLSLSTLDLSNNQLSSLPAGIFDGLSTLTSVDLSGNTTDPISLSVVLEKVGTNQIKAVVPTGAPFSITLPISVANGSLSGSTSLTIPTGSVESSRQTISRTSNTIGAVTADIGALPSLPTLHSGYVLAKSINLPLEIFSEINVAPVFTDGTTTTLSIAENTAADTNIGSPVSATDANNDTLTYSLSGTDAASFDIISTTGQLKTKVALDYEAKTSYSVTITVTDGNLTDTISVSISVTDVNENRAPVFTDGESTTRSVAENTDSGVNIGTAVPATDADDDTLTYTLSGTDGTSFSIDSSNGQLRTKAELNYETKTTYSVTITVSDGSLTDSISVTINVTNVEETSDVTTKDTSTPNNAPTFDDGDSTTRTVAENTGSGVDIGNAVSATDEDKDDTLTYTLGGTDASSFSIDSSSGQLKTNATLDYETKTAYSVTITVSDDSLTDSISVTINVTNVEETPAVTTKDTSTPNNAPTFDDGDSTTRTVAENTGSGVDIGNAVSATDEDKDDTLTYTLGGTDASSFSIDSSSGQLKTNATLDYETKTAYSVTITVSDDSLTDSISVTINVTNVEETPAVTTKDTSIPNNAPTFDDGDSTTRSVAENTAANTNIGTAVSATDEDKDDTLTYTLGGTEASVFSIDSTSGQLMTSSTLDYETKNSYSVTITVSDGNGGSDSIMVTVNVTKSIQTGDSLPPNNKDEQLQDEQSDEDKTHNNVVTDSNLAAAVRTKLGLAADTRITVEIMQSLTSLSADVRTNADDDEKITNLSGLQHATNLTWLDLDDNAITDISSLAVLTNLTHLELSGNRHLSDISPLEGLTGLTWLGLSWCQISDISPLKGLTNLRSLFIYHNQISDITPLAGLGNLGVLEIGVNQISDISPLKELTNLEEYNLSYLELHYNQISDVSPLAALTKLTGLELHYNQITDITPLASLIGLRRLTLEGNPITETLPLTGLTNLNYLDIDMHEPLDTEVSIPDTNLKSAVREALGLESGVLLTIELIRGLTSLTADSSGIRDLTGLEYATNLTQLSLVSNKIQSITHLGNLTNLTELKLNDNQIEHIASLSNLTNLTTLYLANNQIRYITAIASLANLTTLRLSGNPITDTSPLTQLTKLNDVDIDFSTPDNTETSTPDNTETSTPDNTETLSPDTKVSIQDNNLESVIRGTLQLEEDTPITVETMQGLTTLSADSSEISDLNGLEYATNLNQLSVTYNQISDISSLSRLTSLTKLYIFGNQISDISSLSGLTNLTDLFIGSNQISNIPSLSGLTSLTTLNISFNSLSDVTPLKSLTSLTLLVLSNNQISDISSLASLTNLTDLYLSDNQISDISFLSGLTNLSTLLLNNNQITDVTSLSGLVNLDFLWLNGNQISDFTPLASLTNLSSMDFQIPNAPAYEIEETHPKQTQLLANFPNPFNPETWIPYHLATPTDVSLTIYDIRGFIVRELKLGWKSAGYYQNRNRAIHWDGRNSIGERVAGGTYFYQLQAGNMSYLRKMVILK